MDLWGDSNAVVREHWRDIASVMGHGGKSDSDQFASLLQLVFFFGVACGATTADSHGAVGLGNLLPARPAALFVIPATVLTSSPPTPS